MLRKKDRGMIVMIREGTRECEGVGKMIGKKVKQRYGGKIGRERRKEGRELVIAMQNRVRKV